MGVLHAFALTCLIISGLAYIAAAVVRWRRLGSPEPASDHVGGLTIIGLACLTAALVASLVEGGARDFSYAVLGLWAAVGAVQFATGLLTAPNRGLLVLPVGGAAILVALSGLAHHEVPQASAPSIQAITIAHSMAMASYLAVALVAGGAGGLYLVAVQALKRASPRALNLPALPMLAIITERALVITTALLMAGLALGGAAVEVSGKISLGHPSIVLALINLLLLVLVFSLYLSGRLGRRGMALAAVQTMVLAALVAICLLMVRHGTLPNG